MARPWRGGAGVAPAVDGHGRSAGAGASGAARILRSSTTSFVLLTRAATVRPLGPGRQRADDREVGLAAVPLDEQRRVETDLAVRREIGAQIGGDRRKFFGREFRVGGEVGQHELGLDFLRGAEVGSELTRGVAMREQQRAARDRLRKPGRQNRGGEFSQSLFWVGRRRRAGRPSPRA